MFVALELPKGVVVRVRKNPIMDSSMAARGNKSQTKGMNLNNYVNNNTASRAGRNVPIPVHSIPKAVPFHLKIADLSFTSFHIYC